MKYLFTPGFHNKVRFYYLTSHDSHSTLTAAMIIFSPVLWTIKEERLVHEIILNNIDLDFFSSFQDNIILFLRGCKELGLKESQLFDPSDLQDTSNRVTVK